MVKRKEWKKDFEKREGRLILKQKAHNQMHKETSHFQNNLSTRNRQATETRVGQGVCARGQTSRATIVGIDHDRPADESGKYPGSVECVDTDGIQLAGRVCPILLEESSVPESSGTSIAIDENAETSTGGMDRVRTRNEWL